MSASPTARYASRSEAVSNGWFSRRHRSNEEHAKAGILRDSRIHQQSETAKENARNRRLRSNKAQMDFLDMLLGKGIGAKKERARLSK